MIGTSPPKNRLPSPIFSLLISFILLLGMISLLFSQPSAAEVPGSIDLTVTLRDFKGATEIGGHADFESVIGDDRGVVESTLGVDGKPVYASDTATPTTHGATLFNQWYNDEAGVNLKASKTITLSKVSDIPLLYQYAKEAYFPIDNELFGNTPGWSNNFHFTSEIHTQFTYQGGESFAFSGDDDVWVFINDKLVIDLGGVHPAESASVNLDDIASNTGLIVGLTYPLDIFQAERHTSGSSFLITTAILLENPPPVDNTAPVINVPDDIVVEGNTEGGASLEYQVTVTDDDPNYFFACGPPQGTIFPVGTTTVFCTAEDTAGNIGHGEFTITVHDTTPPSMTVDNISVPSNTPGGAIVTFTVIVEDKVDGTITASCVPPPGSTFSVGTTSVTCTATDHSTNTVSATFLVTVTEDDTDTTAPVVDVPDSFVIEGNTAGGAFLAYDVTVTDDDPNFFLACSPTQGAVLQIGTTSVVCTAEDSSGNQGQGVFTVTVPDTTPPSITCPPSQEYQRASEVPIATPDDATASDIVDQSLTMSVSETTSTGFNPTIITRTYSASDDSGNASTCTQIIRIVGAPTIADLIEQIKSINLHHGTETSLLATLKNAQETLDDGNPNNDSSVCGKLSAFLSKVDQNEAQDKLTSTQANELRETGEIILNEIGCP